jgi:hypothetical protein
MYLCIIYVCMYELRMYVLCIHQRTHAYMYVCVYVCVYVCMYACVCTRVYAYTRVSIHVDYTQIDLDAAYVDCSVGYVASKKVCV